MRTTTAIFLGFISSLSPASTIFAVVSDTNRLREASSSLDQLIQPVEVQSVKSHDWLVTRSTNVEPFDLQAALPGIAKLLHLDTMEFTNALAMTNTVTGKSCSLSDVALARMVARQTGTSFQQVMRKTPGCNWPAVLQQHRVALSDAVDYLDQLYMEIAFLKFDQRTNKNKGDARGKKKGDGPIPP